MGVSLPVLGVPGLLGGGVDPVALLRDYLDTSANGGVLWDFQDASGAVAVAYNSALALGRDVVINGDFANWTGDDPDNWTVIEPAPGEITQRDSGQLNAGTNLVGGSANFYNNAGTTNRPVATQTVVSAGSTWQYEVVCSAYGSGTLQILIGGTIISLPQSTGTHTGSATAAVTSNLDVRLEGTSGDITVDSIAVKQTGILASSAYPGAELLVDGDMEAADTSAWTSSSGGVLSKQTTNPRSGTRLLRTAITGGDTIGGALQAVLTIGKRYKFAGYHRSDSTAYPVVGDSSLSNLSGLVTLSRSTDWTLYEVEFLATAVNINLGAFDAGGGEVYIEWDDVSITEVNPLNADHTGVTVAQPGPAGLFAVSVDGSNDYTNAFSAELNSMFDPTQGTLLVAAKVRDVSVWTDGEIRYAVLLRSSSDANRIFLRKSNTASQLNVTFQAGGTQKQINISTSTADWFLLAITFDTIADEVKAYLNDTQSGSTLTGLGSWVGNLESTNAVIGALATTGGQHWDGLLTVPVLYRDVLSADQILQIARSLGVA